MKRLLLPAILGSIISVLVLGNNDVPYLWIALLWFGICLYWTLTEKRQKVKPVWFNIGFLMLILGGFEAYFWITENCKARYFEGSYLDNFFVADDILGYAPDKGRTVVAEKYSGDDLIYKVTYTIDSNGLRISPPRKNSDNECVLFFGGSFTLGEGVNDSETLPYVVGVESAYDTYNFGFSGYGPHQMLAAIENDLVEERTKGCSPKFVFYQAFLDHPSRAAGKSTWDQHGPDYLLLSDGTVHYVGHFDDHQTLSNNILSIRLKTQLSKSFFYNRLFNRRAPVGEQDIDLMVGIVAASKALLLEKYPDSSFQMIYWNFHPEDSGESLLISRLRTAGIEVHLVSDILPDYPENMVPYRVDTCDNHPNALAYKETADYIVTSILDK